jgi:hypothetical protein
MKLRSLVLLGTGVALGYSLAQRLHEDDPEVLRGPTRTASTSNPALRVASAGAQRLADRATVASLGAIRRARGAIQTRLGESDVYDEVAWN